MAYIMSTRVIAPMKDLQEMHMHLYVEVSYSLASKTLLFLSFGKMVGPEESSKSFTMNGSNYMHMYSDNFFRVESTVRCKKESILSGCNCENT